jgi:hypothetical protein
MFQIRLAFILSTSIIFSALLMLQSSSFVSASTNEGAPQDQLVQVDSTKNIYPVSVQPFGGIAPGDSGSYTVRITNSGSKMETVTIQHTLSGEIFRDNGKTGTSLGMAADPSDNYQLHGISVDYNRTKSGNGTEPIIH